jgi:hypothetical protein
MVAVLSLKPTNMGIGIYLKAFTRAIDGRKVIKTIIRYGV